MLVVFDLDGTLVDSRRDIADSANLVLESYDARALSEDTIAGMVGEGAGTLIARAFAAVGRERPPDALERFLTIYETRLLLHTRPYPGIGEVLDALGARASLAVLTNKPLAHTRGILQGLDLARHFADDAVIGGDGPFPRKPDPAGLEHLMARAGTDRESAWLVGDSVVDWRTARNASCAVCLVRYGFGFAGLPPDAIGPRDRMIDAPLELLSL